MKERSFFQKSLIIGGKLISDDWLNFAPLPSILEEDHKTLAAHNDYLTGEHDRIIQKFRTTNEFLENTNFQEIVKRGNQRTSLREIHRVAFLVQTITEESMLVPKGSFSLNYADSLVLPKNHINQWKELALLNGYCYFKKPKNDTIMRYLALREKNENLGFLEECNTSDLKFTILKDYTGLNFYVKSIEWPGFLNYFRANSSIIGHIYFGYGIKNADLHFTLN